MAIEFHCDHCGKMVRTGDEHAGKRGKCPHCQNSVYIPMPSDQIEPLALSPVDETDERHRQELLDETRDLVQRIRSDKDTLPPESAAAPPRPAPMGDARLTAANMESLVIQYAICMAKGKLSEAEELAGDIRTNLKAADEVIQRLTLDEVPPPQLADIPRPVLVRFFKDLREKK